MATETVNIQYQNVSFQDSKAEMETLRNKDEDKSRNNNVIMLNISSNPYVSQTTKHFLAQGTTLSTRKPTQVCNYSTEPSSFLQTRESVDRNKGSLKPQKDQSNNNVTTSSNDPNDEAIQLSPFIEQLNQRQPAERGRNHQINRESFGGRASLNTTYGNMPNYNLEQRTRNSMR